MRSWRLVGAGLIVACALGWAAAPAGADDGVRLSGTAGWAGRCRAGRPLLVRARIGADRLVSGVLSAGTSGPITTEVPVEVTGGTEEEVALVVAAPLGCSEVTLRLQDGRGTTTTRVPASPAGETVLLGLLPGAHRGERPPASATARTGVAAVDVLEPELLDRPGALAGLDSLGATAPDLDGLSPDQRRALFTWVAAGGTLLVDADDAIGLGALPEPWRPPAGGRVAAGRGQVRLTGSALRDGRLDGLAEPGAATSANGQDQNGFGFDMASSNVGGVLQRRSGLRVISLPVILGALGLYVVLVGPGARFGLGRLGRLQLTWLVVPLTAVAFTGLAVAGGDLLRRGGKATHLTVVETDVAGASSRAYVGQPTRTKGTVVANLPTGWLAGGQVEATIGAAVVSHSTTTGQRLQAAAVPGGFVVMGAEGPSSVEGRLRVSADPSGKVEVRNQLRIPLEDVAVFGPGGVVTIGRLEPGAATTVVAPAGNDAIGSDGLARLAWSRSGEGDPRLADPEAFAPLTNTLNGSGSSLGLMAAGWTDRLPSPVSLRSGRPSGTTLVLGRPDPQLSAGVPVGTSSSGMLTTRFVVPAGAAYRLSTVFDQRFGQGLVAGPVQRMPFFGGPFGVEVMVAGRWVVASGGEALPEGAAADGAVYVRSGIGMPFVPKLEAM